MIGRIKRALRGSGDGNSGQLQSTSVASAPEKQETPTQPDGVQGGVYVPDGHSEVERQAEVVRAAMAQGGWFGDRVIPIPWLRRILAGLEGRRIDEEAMWEGIASPPRKDPVEESSTYQELFPTR